MPTCNSLVRGLMMDTSRRGVQVKFLELRLISQQSESSLEVGRKASYCFAVDVVGLCRVSLYPPNLHPQKI